METQHIGLYLQDQGLCPEVLKLSWDQTDESLHEFMGKSDISRLMFEVTIFKQQYGFMPGNCTTDDPSVQNQSHVAENIN